MIFIPEDKYKKLRMESDQRFDPMLNKLNQQMNEFPQKVIELTAITQQVQARYIVCQQTDSTAKSFVNIGSPPRGDTSVPKIAPQISPTVEDIMHILDQHAQNLTVQFTDIIQQVQARSIVCKQTNSAANSFDNIRSPPRGEMIVPKIAPRILPTFWHTFLSHKHIHAKNPSVTKPKYYDSLKFINLLLITVKIDNRNGDGWNKILSEDRFGNSWHK